VRGSRAPAERGAWRRAAGLRGALALLALVGAAASSPVRADQQRDPELRAVVAGAIAQSGCFADKYDSAVWYALMEPKLKRVVKDRDERMRILETAYCEAHREGAQRLPPGLILAVIDVESRFERWAVSSAGAVGLMQVMPFWPEQLGMRRYQLVQVEENLRMGCAILRFYLERERNDVRKALARYNGSIGRREYPDLVITRWTRNWNGADDLIRPRAREARAAP
jgi:soluble lytic murein transglycosylase-like protein